jgi:hypothetical protein
MSHLRNLVLTPFDLGTFARVARQPVRRTLAHLFLLILVATIASTVSLTLGLRELVRRIEPHLDKLPTITIRDGVASADVPQPWVQKLGTDDDKHDIVLIIDTTHESPDRRELAPNEIGLALHRTTLTLVTPGEPPRVFALDKIPDTTLGPDVARRFIDHWMRRIPYYIALALLAWYIFAKVTQATILVLFALIGSSKRRLGFGALFSVGVYALTPAILFASIAALLPFQVPMTFMIYSGLAIAYAILGGQRAAAEPPSDAAPLP